MVEIDRRTFLVTGTLALAGLAAACGNKKPTIPAGASIEGAIDALEAADGRFQVIQAVGEILVKPSSRVSFALIDEAATKRFTGGDIRVYWAQSPDQPARGPAKATYHGEGLGVKGVYVVNIDVSAAGPWTLFAVGTPEEASKELFGSATYQAVDRVAGPAPGAKAISVPTPTVDNHRGVEPYCTRVDTQGAPAPCSLHKISLEVALANGRPTVFNIGTPKFCMSRTCGPVIEVLQIVGAEFADRVNFIHAEVYRNDTDAPAQADNGFSPTAAAYSLTEEPLTYWIRPDQTIAERVVGPTDVAEVRDLTRALLV